MSSGPGIKVSSSRLSVCLPASLSFSLLLECLNKKGWATQLLLLERSCRRADRRHPGCSNHYYVFGSLLCNGTVCLMCSCVSTDRTVHILWRVWPFEEFQTLWPFFAQREPHVQMIAWKLCLQLWLLASEYTGGGEGGCWVLPLKIKIQLILGDSCVEGNVWKLSTGLGSPEEMMVCNLSAICMAIVTSPNTSSLAVFCSRSHLGYIKHYPN